MPRRIRKTRKTTEERQAEAEKLRERLEEWEGDQDEASLAAVFALHDGYSERNAMLIAMQMPGATDVSGFTVWKTRGRSVMAKADWPPGACTIEIVAFAGDGKGKGTDAEPEPKAANGKEKPSRHFRRAHVYDVTCTEPLEVAEARWAAARAASTSAT
jgi:hypothetical protein